MVFKFFSLVCIVLKVFIVNFFCFDDNVKCFSGFMDI